MEIFDIAPKNGISFTHLGAPIDPELRPLWRISLVALILMNLCSGKKANSKKLQALYSLVASEKKRKAYLANSNNYISLNIRFDPLVDRAIDMGVGHNLFELDNAKSIKLTDKGLSFTKRIKLDENIFILEKAFMSNFNTSYFNDTRINALINGEI
jgi:hypothetical protein